MELNSGVWSAFSQKIVMVYAAGWSLRLTHELILANFIWLLEFFNKAIASKFWKQYFYGTRISNNIFRGFVGNRLQNILFGETVLY
jgi:hypothetical protein